jgi:hypothetical protein
MKIVFSALALALLFIACNDDSGIAPTPTGFQGTIRFSGGWPEDTDEIRLAGAVKFPPSTIADIILGEPLPLGKDSLDYTFYTAPVELAAVGVVWKEKGQSWDATNIIGYYFPTENHLSPGSVSVTDQDWMVQGIDINADLSKAKRKVNSMITGMLRVQGPWPAGATDVIVAASTAPLLPTSLLDLMFSFPITAGFDSARYVLPVQPGTYKLVAALVIEKGKSIGLESIRGNFFSFTGIKITTPETVVTDIDLNLIFPANGLSTGIDNSSPAGIHPASSAPLN